MYLSFDEFRDKLKIAYPVSKWELKIPISVELEEFKEINFDEIVSNLDGIMQQIFDQKDLRLKLLQKENKIFINLLENKFTWIVRFDCMFNKKKELKVIEVNTSWPDWLLMHDFTYSTLLWKENKRNLINFLKLFSKDDVIFILYDENSFFLDPHFLEYNFLKENWYKVFIWTKKDLKLEDDWVFFDWVKINVIRLAMSHNLLEEKFIKSLINKKLKFINTFDLFWCWNKSLLNFLNHKFLLKSFNLTNSTYLDAINNKDYYVLKPSNLSEWKWIIIWKDVKQDIWEKEILRNLNNDYLIQEYLDIYKIERNMYIDWTIKSKKMYFDFCPHLFYKEGKLIWVWQVLVRYSENKIVNVLRGGWIWYFNF